jgi:hypothetical protein
LRTKYSAISMAVTLALIAPVFVVINGPRMRYLLAFMAGSSLFIVPSLIVTGRRWDLVTANEARAKPETQGSVEDDASPSPRGVHLPSVSEANAALGPPSATFPPPPPSRPDL